MMATVQESGSTLAQKDEHCHPFNLHVVKNYRGCVYIDWVEPKDISPSATFETEIYVWTLKKNTRRNKDIKHREIVSKCDNCVPPYKLPNVFVGQSYDVKVSVKDKNNRKYDELKVTVISETSHPQQIKRVEGKEDVISIEWDKPMYDGGSPISSYEIRLCEAGENKYKLKDNVDATRECKYTIKKEMMPQYPFTIAVFAINAFGRSLRPAELPIFDPKEEQHSSTEDPLVYDIDDHDTYEKGLLENKRINSLEESTLDEIETIISADSTEVSDDELLEYDVTKSRQAVDEMLAMDYGGYAVHFLDDAFYELRINPNACDFIRRKRNQDNTSVGMGEPAAEPMDTGEAPDAAASKGICRTEDEKHIGSLEERFNQFASKASKFTGVHIQGYRQAKGEVMIYFQTEQGVSSSDAEYRLEDTAKAYFGDLNIRSTSDDPSKLTLTCRDNLVIGGSISVGKPTLSARVGGYFVINGHKYAISVDHIFGGVGCTCRLVEIEWLNMRPRIQLGSKIAGVRNTESGQFLLPSNDVPYFDICLVQLDDASVSISNAFTGVEGLHGTPRLEPKLDVPLKYGDWAPGAEVYICGLSRNEESRKGRIKHVFFTRGCLLNLIAVEPINGNFVPGPGDCGRLVTRTRLVEGKFVGVYGMIIGVDEDRYTIVFPLCSQLRQLFSRPSPIQNQLQEVEFYHH